MSQANLPKPDAALMSRLQAIPGTQQSVQHDDGLWIEAPELDLEAMAREMKALEYRLATMTGRARADGETTVIYHWVRPGLAIHFKTASHGGTLPSLARTVRPASWCEREIHDFFGLKFAGHPNLAPLFRPPGLEDGFFRESPPEAPASKEV